MELNTGEIKAGARIVVEFMQSLPQRSEMNVLSRAVDEFAQKATRDIGGLRVTLSKTQDAYQTISMALCELRIN